MPTRNLSKAERKERIERIFLFLITKNPNFKFISYEQKHNNRRTLQSTNSVPR